MAHISEKLKTPYHLHLPLKTRTQLLLSLCTVLFLFLYIFRPYGLNFLTEPYERLVVIGGYTCAGAATWSFILFYLLPVQQQASWSLAKLLMVNLFATVAIGIACWLFHEFYFNDGHPRSGNILLFQYYALTTGLIPIAFTLLIYQNTLYHRERKDEASAGKRQKKEEQRVTLSAENVQNNFTINIQDLLYIQALDNYVTIYFTRNGEVKKELLRSSLKRMEEDLKPFPAFHRCHRSYIVNLSRVDKVTGNSLSSQCRFRNIEATVPISRAKHHELLQLLQQS